MKYEFLNIFLSPKELLEQSKKEINSFLFENNTSQIEKIYDFFKNDSKLLFANGYLGTGKAQIVDYCRAFLSQESITLKYNCFNSTVLDDILLCFYKEFKNFVFQKKINEPKIRAANFTEKVNSYFVNIEKSFLIIIDSFEAILDENKKEVSDFLLHLMSLDKVKIVIISRTLEQKYFKNIQFENITMPPLERSIFERLLKDRKIKATNEIVDEFYKNTKGYYYFINLSLKIMKNENLSLTDFMIKMTESYKSFNDYLGIKALDLVPTNEKNTFWLFSMLRHPLSIELLQKLKLYNEPTIDFLIENCLLTKVENQLYLKDYLKDFAYDAIPQSIAPRIHQYIIDLYSTQLPLKPLERDICISRQTLRKEIEYNQLFLPRHLRKDSALDVNYLTYSQPKDLGNKDKIENIKEKIDESKDIKKQPEKTTPIDLTQRKNISINLENLPMQSKSQMKNVVKDDKLEEPQEENTDSMTIKELIKLIKGAEASYRYTKVIELCDKALQKTNDENYQSYLPMLYIELGYSYQKIAKYESSLKYYNLAKELYTNEGKFVKANHLKLSIANIYIETYKFAQAKILLLEILQDEKNPRSLMVKTYLALANIEETSSNIEEAFKYYQKAVEVADDATDAETLSEIYFKYALALDDKNDIKNAVEFYTKCIDITDDPRVNKFLSSAYSNIATLHGERNDIENAIINFKKAYETDQKNNNIEGMYYAASKLADLLKKKDPEKALDYYYKALDCSKLTKDSFYIVSAALALGDFNYDRKENEIALKNYLFALELANDSFSKDNIDKINLRINDIKFRLGVEKFENLVEIIKQQNQNEN